MVGKFVRSDGRKIPTSFGGLLLYGLGRPRSGDSSRRVKSEPASTPAPLEAVAPPAPKPERASEPTPRPEKAAEPALEPALAPERTPKPAPEPAPEPTPKSAPEPAPKPASEPAPEPAPGPAGEIEKPAEWTQADDDTLIKMKEEKKTWAEIEGAIEEKERDAIKARYKELMSKKSVETSQAEADSPESKIDIRKGKGKGKEERKSKEVQDTKDNPPNNGRPLIHFDQGDGLTIEDINVLYTLFEQYEERKWTVIASKLFDKTGKRIDPEVLKGKMAITRLHILRELRKPQEYSKSDIMGFEGETQHEITVSDGRNTQRRPPSSEVQWLNGSQDPQDLQELKDIADLQRPFSIFFKDFSAGNTASTVDDMPGKWIAVSDLASILASFAQAEGMMLPPRPSTDVRSSAVKRIPKCAPEHLAAVLPPPSANASDLGSFMRLFLNHTRTNSQHWPLTRAPATAKSGDLIRGNGVAGQHLTKQHFYIPEWSEFEDQVIFDATLRGEGWYGCAELARASFRSPQEILARTRTLKNVRLPAMWNQTHKDAQKFLRDQLHRGECELSVEEWEELTVWVYHGFEGINPSVFHYSRCTERLRKEVRVLLEDLDADLLRRVGAYFSKERSGRMPKLQVSVFKPGTPRRVEAATKA